MISWFHHVLAGLPVMFDASCHASKLAKFLHVLPTLFPPQEASCTGTPTFQSRTWTKTAIPPKNVAQYTPETIMEVEHGLLEDCLPLQTGG